MFFHHFFIPISNKGDFNWTRKHLALLLYVNRQTRHSFIPFIIYLYFSFTFHAYIRFRTSFSFSAIDSPLTANAITFYSTNIFPTMICDLKKKTSLYLKSLLSLSAEIFRINLFPWREFMLLKLNSFVVLFLC